MIPTREVKVKLWNKTFKVMYKEVISVNFKDCTITVRSGEIKVVKEWRDGGKRVFNPEIATFSYSDTILINFTGCKDFFGKDIYEGDILEAGDRERNVVASIDGIYKWGIHALISPIVQQKWLKVIGNIWENPNLFKGE